jgi:hypothetical protein
MSDELLPEHAYVSMLRISSAYTCKNIAYICPPLRRVAAGEGGGVGGVGVFCHGVGVGGVMVGGMGGCVRVRACMRARCIINIGCIQSQYDVR